MSISVSIEPSQPAVAAGQPATCIATIKNTSSLVESYDITVLGEAARWGDVVPASISLLPGAERTVDVIFRPPRAPTPRASTYPFAVKVVPSGHPDESVVAEGDVTVEPFTQLVPTLVPMTSRAVRTGRHLLRLHNEGNAPLRVAVTLSDPDNVLHLAGGTEPVVIGPGVTGAVRIKARPRRIIYVGQAKHHPFQANIEPTDGQPIVVNGGVSQKPVVPRWLPRAAIVLVVALIGLWFLANRRAQVENVAALAPDVSSSSSSSSSSSGSSESSSDGGSAASSASASTASSGSGTEGLEPGLTAAQVAALRQSCDAYDPATLAPVDSPTTTTTSTTTSTVSSSGPPATPSQLTTDNPAVVFTFSNPLDRAAAQIILGGYAAVCRIPRGSTDQARQTMVLEPFAPPPALSGSLASAEHCDAYDGRSVLLMPADTDHAGPWVADASKQPPFNIQDVDNIANGSLVVGIAKAHTQRCWIGGGDQWSSLAGDPAGFDILEYWR